MSRHSSQLRRGFKYKDMPKGVYKHKPHTERTKEKIRQAHLERKERLGYINSPETRRKIGLSRLGKPLKGHRKIGWKLSEETKKKLSRIKKELGTKPPSPKGKKYSKEHRENMARVRRGDKSHFWKGGISPLHHLLRTCWKYNEWRTQIYKRDNYTCQHCEVRGGKLSADHYPKSFATFLREIQEIEPNKDRWFEIAIKYEPLWKAEGRTLCLACHKKTDTFGWKGVQKS